MKSITQIAGGKPGLFEGFHEIQRFFEESGDLRMLNVYIIL
jgi:hypothetical protein